MSTEGGDRAGLRERKKQETRAALSWAALRLAVERGLDDVRVEDIAAEAGVSPRTFNNYFSSKGEAIVARHVDRTRGLAAELRAQPASKPLWDAITDATLAQFQVQEGFPVQDGAQEGVPDMWWVTGVRRVLAEPALQGEWFKASAAAEAEIAAAIADRTGTDVTRDLYPLLVARTVGAAVTVAMDHWLHADSPVPITTSLREALRLLAAGLPVP
ncbi:acyl-CoA-like ligand-binding transcription factor [Sphaerisporangium perillae]|uniref:acyl-CoA-like ligand-binding transcription factor n=1 Tax=Sphaerisporangium perillae TaxID=2935860 RepID=UPI0020109DA0|nr:TetR family transcriptional regulator [Sphaerisporangium perillae]